MTILGYALLFLGGYIVGTIVTSASFIWADYKRDKAIEAEISKGRNVSGK